MVKQLALLVVSLGVASSSFSQTLIARTTDSGSLIPGLTYVQPAPTFGPPSFAMGGPPPQMPGFPKIVGSHQNFAPARGMVFADLDGDGDDEILMSSTDSRIYAWHHDGTTVTGFPVVTSGWPQYPPSVADLDGDGDLEIVQTTRGISSGGLLYVVSHTGSVLPGFPKSLNGNNVEFCGTLYDLDGDGDKEIIVGERAYPIGYLHVVEYDGSEWSGNWPFALDHVPTMTAAVGDVDGDGSPEIFYCSYTSMYLLRTDGTVMPGWPKQISGGNFSYQSAAMADGDGDGDLEIFVGAHQSAAGIYGFHHDGTPVSGWPKLVGTWTYCPPTITDLEGDGVLEVIAGRAGSISPPSAAFWAWDANGNVKPGFPYYGPSNMGGSEGPMTVADIDGDGLMEIFADSNIMQDGQGFLYGVRSNGSPIPGFPLRTDGFTYLNGATIGDVDKDGDLELGVVARRDTVVTIYLYDLPQTFGQTGREWPTYHHKNARGGLYPQATPVPPTAFSVTQGALVSGTLQDLLSSDDSRVVVEARRPTELAVASAEIQVTGTSPTASPGSLTFVVEAASNGAPARQRIELFNYQTNSWETVDERDTAPSDRTVSVTIVSNASRFVQPATRAVRARIGIHDRGVTFLSWGATYDFVQWRVGG